MVLKVYFYPFFGAASFYVKNVIIKAIFNCFYCLPPHIVQYNQVGTYLKMNYETITCALSWFTFFY